MALIVPLTLPATSTVRDGVVVDVPETTHEHAYARVLVSRVHADDSYVCVVWYADEAARLAGADPVKAQEFIAKTAALTGTYLPAVYGFLKTLPEFSLATDHPFVDPAESADAATAPSPDTEAAVEPPPPETPNTPDPEPVFEGTYDPADPAPTN